MHNKGVFELRLSRAAIRVGGEGGSDTRVQKPKLMVLSSKQLYKRSDRNQCGRGPDTDDYGDIVIRAGPDGRADKTQ